MQAVPSREPDFSPQRLGNRFSYPCDDRGWVPDLDDAATIGALEAVVGEMLGHDGVNVIVSVRWSPASQYRVTRWRRTDHGWSPLTVGGNDHPSKGAALAAAILAAPQ